MNDLSLVSWSVSNFSIRVVIIIIMDHSYNNNNKWRSDAIFSDPRVWINHGSTMDQHGSTWIKRPSACPPWLMRHASWLMDHVSCVHALSPFSVSRPRLTSHASCVSRPRLTSHASCVPLTWQASHSRLMRHASHSRGRRPTHVSGVPLTSHASCVPLTCQASHSRLMRPTWTPPFSTRPLSVMTTTKRRSFIHASPFRFAPIELYSMGVILPYCPCCTAQQARIETGRGAHSNAAACCCSTKKAGIMPALFLKAWD